MVTKNKISFFEAYILRNLPECKRLLKKTKQKQKKSASSNLSFTSIKRNSYDKDENFKCYSCCSNYSNVVKVYDRDIINITKSFKIQLKISERGRNIILWKSMFMFSEKKQDMWSCREIIARTFFFIAIVNAEENVLFLFVNFLIKNTSQ